MRYNLEEVEIFYLMHSVRSFPQRRISDVIAEDRKPAPSRVSGYGASASHGRG